ncbi:hypothetical protein BD410DRAFT_76648 [Rickenella mellea]|uniref:MYND-type domain-containing protein n=1 Tax=Rickenella mellea TaxID=50990 RepID=A0A4Y7QBK2_9AGAM|nr:hypothetical protein BD410DRAFT_76648 [Rickenella mellea]
MITRSRRRRQPTSNIATSRKILTSHFPLHQVGLFIQLDPSRLQAMMAEGGSDLEAFLLDEPVDVGPWRRYAYQIERDVERDEEADDDDRFNASDVHEKAGEDLAAHILIWLISDINVAFVLGEPSNEDELRWADKAMKRLVKWSTDPFYRDLLGDPLTDAMCPIYWNESLLVKFSQNGGMAALYGDWNQTKKSLMAVTRELQNKINHEEPSIVKHPVYLNALFNIHSRYGLAAFQRTAKIETWQSPIIFQFLCHRIKKDCLTFRTKQDWIPLLGEFVILPDVVRRRYKWAHMSISCQWDCLTFYGCDNDSCPEQQALVRLRGKRVRGVRDPEIEERLRVWGAKSKACSKCEESSYCSQFCQKAHWPAHKPTCLESRARRSKRVIGGSPH